MSRARVAVLKAVSGQLSVTAAAAEYGFSRRHLHRLLARYREGGLDALEPRSRAPRTHPARTSREICGRVIELRVQLTADGLDAGPVTIAWHLEQEGLRPPAPATISRILTGAGLISPQPRKRPRSSYLRFEMAQPNEMWQSDFIHWRLADGTDVEVLNWLDDHSRYLLSCTVHQPVSGDAVVAAFLDLVERYGAPVSTLSDNRGRLHQPVHRRAQRVRVCPGAARGPPEERISGAPADAGQDRTLSPDPAALARGPAAGRQHRGAARPAPRVPRALQASGDRTAPCTAEPPATPTARPRKPPPPPTDTAPGTTGCATTGSIAKAG
jgi:transposase InsO family protein